MGVVILLAAIVIFAVGFACGAAWMYRLLSRATDEAFDEFERKQ